MTLYVSTRIAKTVLDISNPTRRISPSCASQSHKEILRLSRLETITCSSCFGILRCNSPADRGASRLSHRIRPRLAGRCSLARAISSCLVPCVMLSHTSRLAGEACEGTKNISFKCSTRWETMQSYPWPCPVPVVGLLRNISFKALDKAISRT